MNDILKNLHDPSWWFTGIFFILVGLLISKLVRKWAPFFEEYLSAKIPFLAKSVFRRIKLERLRAIKAVRFDDVLVVREIIKSYIFLSLFLLSVFILFSAFFGASTDLEIKQDTLSDRKQIFLVTMGLLSIPTYIFEWLYLRQSSFVKRLLKSRSKIRTRKRSNWMR